ncbi:putative neural-cadherin [Penaeus vannamei]|uniref:Putative neural-cadherin n=1 Tax=Penaeus vannamei TaxID=6689 RepID=A0A3R7PD93_PENVA|nr:putative neural-cadherin [Penaeus vannamei]
MALIKLQDLGAPPRAAAARPAAGPRSGRAGRGAGECGLRGACVGGLRQPECECLPGWAGPGCATPTPPVALGAASYVKVALSFTPSPWSVGVQLRVRTHGARDGLLLLLAAHPATRPHAADIQSLGQGLSRRLSWIPDGFPSVSPRSPPGVLKAFLWLLKRPTDITDKIVREASLPTLSLVPLTPTAARGRGVRVCSGAGVGGAAAEACVDGRPLGDGEWHTVSAERHAHNLLVGVDDGDAWRSNASLITLEEAEGGPGRRRPPALDVDKQEGVVVGGLPVFEEAGLVSVRADLREACVADIRVCGRPLPVPPASNSSTWGQVTMAEGVHGDCAAVDACANTTCAAPLTCATTWGKPTCSCGPGQHLAERTCIDIDECTWGPCLHGGTCYNTQPGFTCECAPAYTGQHCQWALADRQTDVLAAPAAIVGLTVSCLVLEVQSTSLTSEVKAGGHGEVTTTPATTSSPRLVRTGLRHDPLVPNDDLRAYAYEGDGSSSGSLTSTISRLRLEDSDEGDIRPLVPEFFEVMDLLRNLPEATSTLKQRRKPPSPVAETRPTDTTIITTTTTTTTIVSALPSGETTRGSSGSCSSGSPASTVVENELSTLC